MKPAVSLPALGSHITFEAADLELQMAAHGTSPGVAVLCWSIIGLPRSTASGLLKIRDVRIIGTCAVCGKQGPVSVCAECDRDAGPPPCMVERDGKNLCAECVA